MAISFIYFNTGAVVGQLCSVFELCAFRQFHNNAEQKCSIIIMFVIFVYFGYVCYLDGYHSMLL